MKEDTESVKALSRRVRLSSKGQVVIPSEFRERLNLHPGDELLLHMLSDGVLVAERVEPTPLERVMAELQREARKRKITRAMLEEAVKEARQEVYREMYGDRVRRRTAKRSGDPKASAADTLHAK